ARGGRSGRLGRTHGSTPAAEARREVMSRRTRRQFVRESTATASAITALGSSTAHAAGPGGVEFVSSWQRAPNRVWIGPEFWANPLQDWRLAGGRVECHKAAPERHVHLLTHALTGAVGNF